jgi:hypothetical protein
MAFGKKSGFNDYTDISGHGPTEHCGSAFSGKRQDKRDCEIN